jgi:hypothetical protein
MTEQRDAGGFELPANLQSRIEARLPRTQFDSVEAYVALVLKEVLHVVEQETDLDEEFGAADESVVKDRLESLGYLNE